MLHCFNTIEDLVALSTKAKNIVRHKGLVTPSNQMRAGV